MKNQITVKTNDYGVRPIGSKLNHHGKDWVVVARSEDRLKLQDFDVAEKNRFLKKAERLGVSLSEAAKLYDNGARFTW